MEDTATVDTETVAQDTEGVAIGTTIVLMEDREAGFPIVCKNCERNAVMKSPKAEFCSEDCRFEYHGNRKPKRHEASGLLF